MARTVAVPLTPTTGVFTSCSVKVGTMENATLAPLASPGDDAVSTQLLLGVSTVRSAKSATPATAFRVTVPPRTAPAGPLESAIVIGPVKPVAMLSYWSCAHAVKPGRIGWPSIPLTVENRTMTAVAGPAMVVAVNG